MDKLIFGLIYLSVLLCVPCAVGQEINLMGHGFRRVRALKSGDDILVRTQLKALRRCMFGDLDALGMEVLASDPKKTKILLSVESLTSRKNAAIYSSVKDITNPGGIKAVNIEGYDVEFSLPRSNGAPQLYGVYVCKDSLGEGSCRNKGFEEINAILARYQHSGEVTAESNPSDKIYYFKLLVIAGSDIYYPERRLTGADLQVLSDFLASKGAKMDAVKPALIEAERIQSVLGSLHTGRLKADASKVALYLPRYDPLKCG